MIKGKILLEDDEIVKPEKRKGVTKKMVNAYSPT